MKFDIKSLLTGTTLFVASASSIDAVPPKGIELIPGVTITHPIFGEMEVISHKEDLDFYKKKVREEEEEGVRESWRILEENFIQYVLGDDAFEQCENFSQGNIEHFVRRVISKSVAGMAMLEVITANYMREYDRIKQFCENHQAELKACYDFSQTEKGKDLYEKERQIFELEEKLKDLLWKIQSERLESQFSKSGISSDDLKNLYEYFRKEEEVFNNELKESWTQLRKEDSEGFFIGEKDYEPFCKLYEHFLKKNDDDSDDDSDNNLAIHQSIGQDSERYKKLQKFVVDHQTGFENFFNIGDLCFAGKTLLRDSFDERCCRNYYSEHTKDLEQLSLFRQEEAELLETAKLNTEAESFLASMDKLEKLYKEETKKVNEEKFSCIRRSVIPACYFPILYRHFFVKGDPKYSDIENVNKFLYRTLKFKDGEKGCSFDWRTLSVMGNWDEEEEEEEEIQNYHVNDRNEFLDCNVENRTTPLQHELMHFMNAIDDLNRLKACEKISKKLVGIIKTDGIACKLEIQIVKPKEEESKEEGDYGDRCITKLLRKLYDNGGEMWAMYGVCICEDKQNPGKYILYYDPINEAFANAKALGVVRTGHARFKKENHIDSDNEESPSEIEVLEALNKKIGIYNFYFSEGKKLRKLVHM